MKHVGRRPFHVGLLVAIAGLSAIAACSDRVITEPSITARRNSAAQNGNGNAKGDAIIEVSGRMTRKRVTQHADGSRWLTTEDNDIRQSYKKDGTPNENANVNAFKSQTQIAQVPITQASFVSSVADTMVNGHTYKRSIYKTKRVFAKQIDGQNVELRGVSSADGRQTVGYVFMVDGKMREQIEVTRKANNKGLASVRILSFDKNGHFLAEDQSDVSKLTVGERLVVAERSGLRKAVGRILNGAANLVLPDQLLAQDHWSDPCRDADDNRTLYNELLGAAIVISESLAVACVEIGLVPIIGQLTCAAAASAVLATIPLIIAAEHYEGVFLVCRDANPSCGSYWGSNGTCNTPTTGGGGGGNTGGTGGTGSSGSGSSGGRSVTICGYLQWYDPQTSTTWSDTDLTCWVVPI